MHLLDLDCNLDVEQSTSAFLGLVPLLSMKEQTAAEDPSKVHERPAIADRTFVTPAVADHLTIEAEDRIPERKATFV
jgi:hypothetical protein